jgi:hypothetical protein
LNRVPTVFAVVLVLVLFVPAPSAHAAGVFASGSIHVNPDDFVACGTVSFDSVQKVIAGEMTAGGTGSTLTTQENAIIRDAQPILAFNTRSVEVCTEGLNFVPNPGIVVANVAWTLSASGDSGDVLVTMTCFQTPQFGFECFSI